MKSPPEDEPRKTVLDRLIGSLKWGTIGTIAGGAAGVGLGAIARKGHFGKSFTEYANRKFPLFPSPAVTHGIAGAGVGSKVGALAGLIAGRKKKDVKELSALLDDLIELGIKRPTPGTAQSIDRYGNDLDMIRNINAVARGKKPVMWASADDPKLHGITGREALDILKRKNLVATHISSGSGRRPAKYAIHKPDNPGVASDLRKAASMAGPSAARSRKLGTVLGYTKKEINQFIKRVHLSQNLDDLIELAWKRPVVIRVQNKKDFNDAAELFRTGETASSGGLAMSPSSASKKGHYRDFNFRNRQLSEDVRKGGLIIGPSDTSSLARLEKISAKGAYNTQKDAARTVMRHELVHTLRDPMNYSKDARRALAGGKGYLHTLKEEAAANYATLLGKRGKQLGTPLLKRLAHAARLTATYLKP